MKRTGSLLIALAGWLTATALAQNALFVMPDQFSLAEGATARVRALAGQPAAAAPRPWPEVRWLFSRSPGVQENLEDTKAAPGEDFLGVPTGRAGVTVIGLDLPPTTLALSSEEWSAFVAEHVLTVPEARSVAGDGRGVRIRQIASAKTLIRIRADDGPGVSSAEAMSKAGLKAEIRPGADPTRLRVGSDLPLVVYADNIKRKARVTATALSGEAAQTVDIGAGGMAVIRITHTGIWRIAFHFLESAPPGEPQADYVVYSGTLTFEVPEGVQ